VLPDSPATSSHSVNPLHIPRRSREGISSGANTAQDSWFKSRKHSPRLADQKVSGQSLSTARMPDKIETQDEGLKIAAEWVIPLVSVWFIFCNLLKSRPASQLTSALQ
jgi:hypothetical protein